MITIAPGERRAFARAISQADIDAFAELSGDNNPIHIDPAFAARSRFGRTVAHGMLLASLIRAALRELAPTAAQRHQVLSFTSPTYADEPLQVVVELIELVPGGARLSTSVLRADGTPTCSGEATLVEGG